MKVKMFVRHVALALGAVLLPGLVRAEYEQVGNVVYDYEASAVDSGVTITYAYVTEGDMPESIVIPDALGGMTVTGIDRMFSTWSSDIKVKSLTLPSGLCWIGEHAFAGYPQLTTVTTQGDIESVGRGAFSQTPFMQVAGNKREIAYLGSTALGFKECLVDDVQKAYEEFYGDFMNVPRNDIVLRSGTRHVADGAFESVGFAENGSELWGSYAIPYGKIELPDGLLTIGENAFSSTFYAGTTVGPDLIVPASVLYLGSGSLCGMTDRRTLFAGARPGAVEDPFWNGSYYSGSATIGTVYYAEGQDGWTFGDYWYSVRTVPYAWAGKRTSKFSLGSVYEYLDRSDKHKLVATACAYDEALLAVPVNGATSADEVRPVILHVMSGAEDVAEMTVESDATLFNKVLKPALSKKSSWRLEEDRWGFLYRYEANGVGYRWSQDLWPNAKAVADRFWIIVKLNNNGRWSGLREFRIGLHGTDEVTDRIPIIATPWDAYEAAPAEGVKVANWINRITVTGQKRFFPCADANVHHIAEMPFDADVEYLNFMTYAFVGDTKSLSLTVAVPEAGTLVMSVWDDGLTKGNLSISGQKIVAGSDKYESVEWPNYGDYGIDWSMPDAEERSARYDADCQDYFERVYYRYHGNQVRRVSVSGATTLTLKFPDDDSEFCSLRFFPATKRCVSVDAALGSVKETGGGSCVGYMQGFATGSGVYAAGEPVTLVAHAGPGEAFERWECVTGELPENLDLGSPTLSFVVTDAMCGDPTEERAILIRPVWKEKLAIDVIPSPVGACTVTGDRAGFASNVVTIALEEAQNCTFNRWIDGYDGMNRSFLLSEGTCAIPYYAIFDGTPVNPAPHLEIEGLADSYAVGAAIDPIFVGVASGTGYTVKVPGLPAGLSFANGRITGTPAKTGSYPVTVTATKSGAATLTQQFVLNVTVEFYYEEDVVSEGIILTGTPSMGATGTLVVPSIYEGHAVVGIAEYAFEYCDGITDVILPEGLTTVGDQIFCGVPLASVNIPASLVDIAEGAFAASAPPPVITVADGNPRYCMKDGWLYDLWTDTVIAASRSVWDRTSSAFPDGTLRIGRLCWGRGGDNRTVTIPASVQEIAADNFFGIRNVTINFLGDEPLIDTTDMRCEEGFLGDSTAVKICAIPGSTWDSYMDDTWYNASVVKMPGTYAYYYGNNADGGVTLYQIESTSACSGELILPSVYGGKAVTRIGGGIGYWQGGCHKFTKVTVPGSVRVIDEEAFDEMSTLKDVVLNEGLEEVGEDAFLNCGIASIRIPSTVTSLGNAAFGQNPLTKIEVDPRNERYYATENGLLVDLIGAKVCLSVRNQGALVIPEGVEVIGKNAFELVKISSIRFPRSLRKVEDAGFGAGSEKPAFTFAELDFSQTSLEEVGGMAFWCNTQLKTVRFPATLTRIGAWAFCRCSKLTAVCFAGGVPEVTVDPETVESATAHMPKLVESYPNGDIYVEVSKTAVSLLKSVTTCVTPDNGWEAACPTGIWQGRPVRMTTAVNVVVDGAGGTVTGGGSYDSGTKVALKATPATGYVFAGWYEDDKPLEGLDADYRTASPKLTVPVRNVTIQARFVTKETDAEDLEALVEDRYEVDSVWTLPLEIRSCSLPTVAVSGLPTGLAFDKKTFVISGQPTKPGTYTVTIKLSNLSVKNKEQTFLIVVPNLVSDKIAGLFADSDHYHLTAGVAADGVLEPTVEKGYTISVSGLPKGLSADKTTGVVTGAPTAAPGAYTVTFTAKKGSVTEVATVTLNIEAAPVSAVGVFNGFVGRDEVAGFVNLGTFKLTSSASGALSAVIETSQGKTTLSAKQWSSADDYSFMADFSDKAGNGLALVIDVAGGWDVWQLSGDFYEAKSRRSYKVTAQMNVFGQSWYLKATKVATDVWEFAYADGASEADLTVVTKADGTATAKGKLGGYTVNATSFLAIDGLRDGAFMADFVQFVTVGGTKKTLSIKANLWLDGSDAHEDGAGSAKVEE